VAKSAEGEKKYIKKIKIKYDLLPTPGY
jgi:hypothetical protein